MKKVLLFLVGVIIFITGCSGKLTTYSELSYEKLNDMIEAKEDFILYIGSSECSHCSSYSIALNKVIEKYQVKVYYINIIKLSDEEIKELKKKFNYSGTPTTVFVVDGEEKSIYNRINGNQPYDKIVESFKKNNYIK